MINYYKVLNINHKATTSEVKKAYRKLAMKYHPDSNSGYASVAQFLNVHEAYTILINDNKRKIYDQLLNNEASYISHINNPKTKDNESASDYSKKSKDLERWILEARDLAFKYGKMGYLTFSYTFKKGIYHGNRLLETTCLVVFALPMITMATLGYFAYI